MLVGVLLLAACGDGGGGSSNEAQTFYIRPSGSDGNSGTSPERAFRTLGRAVQGLGPGDVVYVAPGRYVPPAPAPGAPPAAQAVEINGRRGTAEQPIEIIADSSGAATEVAPGEVVVDAEGAAIGVRVSRSTSVVIDGFRIVHAIGDNGAGVQVRSGSDGVVIRNCIVVDNADGIRVEASDDVLVFNNLIHDNGNRGLRVGSGSKRARVVNNTIVGNGNRGIAIGGADGENMAPTGATLRNNLVQDNLNVAISVDEGPPSALLGYSGDFNLVFSAQFRDQIRAYRPAEIRGARDLNLDARFANPAAADFHLSGGSPALDAGTDAIGVPLLAALVARSTRSDGSPDRPPVDIGYHYPAR
jgi:parallel beta-helix repeat protein